MMDVRASLAELAALSTRTGRPRESYEATHYFPHRLWLPGIETTDGQARWGALGLGLTPAGAAEQLCNELTNLPDGQWVEAVQFDRPPADGTRSGYPTRRVRWDGARWTHDDDGKKAD